MKNILVILFTAGALLSLTGCNDTNKVYIAKNAAIPTNLPDYEHDTIANFVIEVDVNQIKALIESKESFALYIGNASCSSCEAFRPALLEYIYKSKSLIYHFDNLLHGTSYEELPTAYPDYFTDQYAPTPSLYFFKDGTLQARRNGSTRMFEYVTFEPIMSGYVKVTSINYVNDTTTLDQIVNQDSSIVFFYSRDDETSNALYNLHLFPYMKNLSSAIYIVDVDYLSLTIDEQLSFIEHYQLSLITGQIVNYHQGTAVTSIMINNDNGEAMVDWLKGFY